MSQSNNWKTVSAVLIGTVLVLSIVIGIVAYQQTIHVTGQITPVKAIGCAVYADGAGLDPLTAINWGSLPPDSAVNVTIWVKNTGNAPVNYTITAQNWVPINANTYLGLTADFKGVVNANVGSIIPIVLTDSVSINAPPNTSYAYDIVITASG